MVPFFIKKNIFFGQSQAQTRTYHARPPLFRRTPLQVQKQRVESPIELKSLDTPDKFCQKWNQSSHVWDAIKMKLNKLNSTHLPLQLWQARFHISSLLLSAAAHTNQKFSLLFSNSHPRAFASAACGDPIKNKAQTKQTPLPSLSTSRLKQITWCNNFPPIIRIAEQSRIPMKKTKKQLKMHLFQFKKQQNILGTRTKNSNSKNGGSLHQMIVSGKMFMAKILAMTLNQTTCHLRTKSAVTFVANSLPLIWPVIGMPPNTISVRAQAIINHKVCSSGIAKTVNQIVA